MVSYAYIVETVNLLAVFFRPIGIRAHCQLQYVEDSGKCSSCFIVG